MSGRQRFLWRRKENGKGREGPVPQSQEPGVSLTHEGGLCHTQDPITTTALSPTHHPQAQSHIPTKTPRQPAHPAPGTQEVEFREEGTMNSGKPSTEGVGRTEGWREEGRRTREARGKQLLRLRAR